MSDCKWALTSFRSLLHVHDGLIALRIVATNDHDDIHAHVHTLVTHQTTTQLITLTRQVGGMVEVWMVCLYWTKHRNTTIAQ